MFVLECHLYLGIFRHAQDVTELVVPKSFNAT